MAQYSFTRYCPTAPITTGIRAGLRVVIGEGGIRTHGPRNRYNSLAGSPIQPLSHLSKTASMNPEKVGFEPTEPCGSTVFKTASFDHSDTSPGFCEHLW